MEWRNATFYADHSRRLPVEVSFAESGTITFGYQGIDGDALQRGGAATIGIENAEGTVALQYSYNHSVLSEGGGVTISPPA